MFRGFKPCNHLPSRPKNTPVRSQIHFPEAIERGLRRHGETLLAPVFDTSAAISALTFFGSKRAWPGTTRRSHADMQLIGGCGESFMLRTGGGLT